MIIVGSMESRPCHSHECSGWPRPAPNKLINEATDAKYMDICDCECIQLLDIDINMIDHKHCFGTHDACNTRIH